MATLQDILEEEIAPDEARVNVKKLLSEFQDYYRQLMKLMKENRMEDASDSYILFGISGAGKSTIVARLTTNEPPESFWGRLIADIEANKTYSEVNGVTIGHTVNSCTIIPQSYRITDHLYICDMPGFAESDKQKKIIIDLLSKIFLTNTKNLKIIIVAEMGILFEDTKLTKLQQNYHDDLEKLLGASYPDAIAHFYFVLTKNHELKKTTEDVGDAVNKVVRQLSRSPGSDPIFDRFLHRLADSHVIVNLQTEDGRDLLSAINGRIVEGRKEHKVHRVSEWSIDHLEAGENLLNKLCRRHIALQSKAVSDLESTKAELVGESNVRFLLADETEDLSSKMKAALRTAVETKNRLDCCHRELESYPEKKDNLEIRKKEAEDLKDMCLRRQKVLSSSNKGVNRYIIQTRVDTSLEQKNFLTGSLTNNKRQAYQLDMNPQVLGDGCIAYGIVVAEYEADDKTIRDTFQTGSSLVPRSMEDLKKLTQPSILYNTTNEISRCEVKRPGNNERRGDVPLRIKHKSRFKVYIFTQTPLQAVFFFQELTKDFQEETEEADEKIKKAEEALMVLDEKLKQNQLDVRRYDVEHKNSCTAIHQIKEEVEQTQIKHEDLCEDIVQKIATGMDAVEKARDDPLLANISDIIKILRTNKIATSAGEPLQVLLASFLPLQSNLGEARNTMLTFKKHDRDALTDILSMALPKG